MVIAYMFYVGVLSCVALGVLLKHIVVTLRKQIKGIDIMWPVTFIKSLSRVNFMKACPAPSKNPLFSLSTQL